MKINRNSIDIMSANIGLPNNQGFGVSDMIYNITGRVNREKKTQAFTGKEKAKEKQ